MRLAVVTSTTRLSRGAIAADEVQPTSAFLGRLMVAARERSSFVETNRDRAARRGQLARDVVLDRPGRAQPL